MCRLLFKAIFVTNLISNKTSLVYVKNARANRALEISL